MEFVEHGFVESSTDPIGLRAFRFGTRMIDVLNREVELVFVSLRVATILERERSSPRTAQDAVSERPRDERLPPLPASRSSRAGYRRHLRDRARARVGFVQEAPARSPCADGAWTAGRAGGAFLRPATKGRAPARGQTMPRASRRGLTDTCLAGDHEESTRAPQSH
jgi:hypothetical protein